MASRTGFYVRANVDVPNAEIADEPAGSDVVGPEGSAVGLTFVDLAARHSAPTVHSERLTSALQEQAHRLASSDRIIIRWPWLAGPGTKPDIELIDAWIRRLTGAGTEPRVFSKHAEVAVVQHRLGDEPVVRWSRQPPSDEETVLAHARAVEVHALLRRSHAVWEPRTYHYKLPNGEHVDVFVRLADAIQVPRDAFALSTWLTPHLRNGVGIVADSGSMTPVLLQLETFLERFGWTVGPVSVLAAYPATRPAVRRSVESAAPEFGDSILGVQSVSSSGALHRTLADELERVADSHGLRWNLVVVVDRERTGEECAAQISTSDPNDISWLGLGDAQRVEPAGTCRLCLDPSKAQYVAIDPRTYGEMALPGPHLAMPDTAYAAAGHLFWERAQATRGIAIEANPHPMSKVARGKRVALPVRPIFELIVQPEGLKELVAKRAPEIDTLARLQQTSLVVAVSGDLERVTRPAFAGGGETDLRESLRCVLDGIGLDPETRVVADSDDRFADALDNLRPDQDVLVFSWGAVTGLTLRRLKLAVADVLGGREGITVNGLVLHSRPSTPREWTALQNQFRPGHLSDLWTSCLPWDSPLVDEYRLLDRTEISPPLSSDGQKFLSDRRKYLDLHAIHVSNDDDWSPRFESGLNPTHVLWGMSDSGVHQSHVRGRSLYGKGLDCVTAYGAIGSVVNYTRLNERPVAAPRWVAFDLGRLVRSYFDALITACAIRWLRPGELWWGSEVDQPQANLDSVAYLIDQARDDPDEQVILLPELLLATAQGKLPAAARDLVREGALKARDGWPNDDRYRTARSAIEVGVALVAATS